MSEVELFEKLSARLDSSDAKAESRFDSVSARLDSSEAKAESRFESVSARLDLVNEKLGAISGRLERIETILDGKDKEGGLIARVGRHQTWLTILTTLVVALLAGFFALSRM